MKNINTECPGCGFQYIVDEEFADDITCNKCGCNFNGLDENPLENFTTSDGLIAKCDKCHTPCQLETQMDRRDGEVRCSGCGNTFYIQDIVRKGFNDENDDEETFTDIENQGGLPLDKEGW